MGKIIGIDLGTTNSVVSVMEGGKPVVIINKEGSRLTPSVVSFTESGERLVGGVAKRQAVTNPENTVYSIKRFMGRRHSEVAQEERIIPYKIEGGQDELVKVRIGTKYYTPPEISAFILADLKDSAETYLGQKVTEAVITVPAYFNDSQRQATKDAGKIAGLEVKRIINEPTASSLAYGLGKTRNEKIAVFDLGGGTFDISILEVGDGVFEVKSTNGDTHLGGDDFDKVVMDWLADEFKHDTGIDIRQDLMALQRLKEAAEKAKCELSTMLQTEVNLPFITADRSGPKHLNKKITRTQFEHMVASLIERVKKPCVQAMQDAKLTPYQIDKVLLVGGATRMPCATRMVKEIFGKEGSSEVNPDEAVAMGAAIQGGILSGDENLKEMVLLDVTPLSLGVETLGGVTTVLISRNTTIPVEKKEIFSTAADSQTAVDIHILQGERPMARDNRTLGRFQLAGIPPAPRGIPQVEVTFNIDANGILNVNAKDLGTGKAQSIIIKSSSGLSQEEVKKMQREAEKYAEEDKKHKEAIDLKNQAEHLIYTTEKTMREYSDKIPEPVRKSVEEEKDKLRKALDSNDPVSIRQAMESFQQKCYKIGESLYSGVKPPQGQGPGPDFGQGGPQPGPSNPKSDPKPGDVIDGDYEVKN